MTSFRYKLNWTDYLMLIAVIALAAEYCAVVAGEVYSARLPQYATWVAAPPCAAPA